MDAGMLERLAPAKEPLFDLLFRQVDESMLQEIAEADYGIDAESHFAELLAIKSGNVPAPIKWRPGEVLELIRWSEPDDASWKPGSVGERGHWMRLFSCAVLIRVAAEPENEGRDIGEESTIIQLVDSAMKLGTDTALATLRFLCWRICAGTAQEWNKPFFAIAILLLAVSLGKCDPQLAQFLIATADSGELPMDELYDSCLKGQTWKDVTRKVLIESTQSNMDLRELGELLM